MFFELRRRSNCMRSRVARVRQRWHDQSTAEHSVSGFRSSGGAISPRDNRLQVGGATWPAEKIALRLDAALGGAGERRRAGGGCDYDDLAARCGRVVGGRVRARKIAHGIVSWNAAGKRNWARGAAGLGGSHFRFGSCERALDVSRKAAGRRVLRRSPAIGFLSANSAPGRSCSCRAGPRGSRSTCRRPTARGSPPVPRRAVPPWRSGAADLGPSSCVPSRGRRPASLAQKCQIHSPALRGS